MNNLNSAYLKRYTNGELKLLINKCQYIIKQRQKQRRENEKQ
jgi:hypothetical protein